MEITANLKDSNEKLGGIRMVDDIKIAGWQAVAGVLACGRTETEQIEAIRRYGNHGASPVLRAATLTAHGIAKPKAKAENCLIFGCYRPFDTPFLVRDYVRLLDILSVDYTYLNHEYCCGVPLAMQASRDRIAEAAAAGREFNRMNLDLAGQKGAAVLAYCCAGCIHSAKETFGQADSRHVYIIDMILDRLEGRRLMMPPTEIGYFEGCHTFARRAYPKVSIDWARYRRRLGEIEGLEVVDLPNTMCCKSSSAKIIEQAAKMNLTQLLSPCSGCYSSLNQQAKDGVRVVTYPELLLQGMEAK